jgi:DNA-binding transcriptional LysR family regulator
VVAIPITPMLEMAVVGSPKYFKRKGVPTTPADLVNHDCVAYRHVSSGSIFRWEFHSLGRKGHAFVVEPHGALIANDDESMVRAAMQGAGLVQDIDVAVRPQLATGALVRVVQAFRGLLPLRSVARAYAGPGAGVQGLSGGEEGAAGGAQGAVRAILAHISAQALDRSTEHSGASNWQGPVAFR